MPLKDDWMIHFAKYLLGTMICGSNHVVPQGWSTSMNFELWESDFSFFDGWNVKNFVRIHIYPELPLNSNKTTSGIITKNLKRHLAELRIIIISKRKTHLFPPRRKLCFLVGSEFPVLFFEVCHLLGLCLGFLLWHDLALQWWNQSLHRRGGFEWKR